MQKLTIVILLFIIGCLSCESKKTESSDSLEQRSLNFLIDSLINSDVFKNKEIIIKPVGFKDVWIKYGLFYNDDLFSDLKIDSLSYPYHDEMTVKFDREHMSDSVYKEAEAFITYYKRNSSDLRIINITTNGFVTKENFGDFKQRVNPNEIFIKVYRNIESNRYKMVRLRFYYYELNEGGLVDFSLFIFFDHNNNLSHWIF